MYKRLYNFFSLQLKEKTFLFMKLRKKSSKSFVSSKFYCFKKVLFMNLSTFRKQC